MVGNTAPSPPEFMDSFKRFYFFHFGKTCPVKVTEADVTGLFDSLLRDEALNPAGLGS